MNMKSFVKPTKSVTNHFFMHKLLPISFLGFETSTKNVQRCHPLPRATWEITPKKHQEMN